MQQGGVQRLGFPDNQEKTTAHSDFPREVQPVLWVFQCFGLNFILLPGQVAPQLAPVLETNTH
jgi:hypothetical protein